ncbi:hypothetical protein PO909_009331 [Leuciscus waleckii]
MTSGMKAGCSGTASWEDSGLLGHGLRDDSGLLRDGLRDDNSLWIGRRLSLPPSPSTMARP